jgi:hypothetical protein
MSVLAPPGTYTVKLSVKERDFTQTLMVRKDPNSGGTEADIQAQTKVMLDLRKDMNDAVGAVNQLELVRGQIENLSKLVEDAGVKTAGEGLNQKLIAVEMNLIDLRITGGQDGVRYASKLISKLNYLGNGLASSDFKPTNQHLDVQKSLEDQLRRVLGDIDGLLSQELGGFNDMLRKKNIQNIMWRLP